MYGVKNLNVDVAEENGNILFLHKIIPGSASRSYGIHVAKLAGIPNKLLMRAQEKLSELELQADATEQSDQIELPNIKLSNFGQDTSIAKEKSPLTSDIIAQKLKDIDLMEITPSQAF